MNVLMEKGRNSFNWSALIMFALGFWLSSSLLLDLVILPGLAATGMTEQAGFASAGYVIFGVFNHIELLCGALVLTGFLTFRNHHHFSDYKETWSIFLAGLLLTIAIIYTYILTPQMSGLGLQLNLFDSTTHSMSPFMTEMQWSYWGLELFKFVAGATLLRWCYRNSCSILPR